MAGYVKGLDSVLKELKRFEKEREEKAKSVVKDAAYVMEAQAKALAPVRTGYLRENIKTHIEDGGLSAEVISHAEYSMHVEYGTSKQIAQQFMTPAFFKAKSHFERSIERG